MNRPRRPFRRIIAAAAATYAAVLAASLSVGLVPAAAVAAAVPAVALDPAGPAAASGDPAPDYYDGGVLDTYSRALFWFNRQVYDNLHALGEAVPGDAFTGAIAHGVGNMAANLVNEPVTALASVASGDFSTAANAVGRFGVNSTVGLLGWNDVATGWGLEPKIADIGLALCQAGVGEGGYVVLPFIGPRTARDGFADVVLVNAALWTLIGASLGTGASWRTILIAESVEIVADIIATRQIDPHAKVEHFDDYEAVRAAYLAQRRARCAELRAK